MSQDNDAAAERVINQLLSVEFPKRYEQARKMHITPFSDGGKNKFANEHNLKLLLALSPNQQRISARRLSNAVGWDLLQVKAILRWAVRRDLIEQLSQNLFAIKEEEN